MFKISAKPIRMAFFLIPQFPMLAFSAAIEPLRAANRLSRRQLFEWQLVSLDGQPVAASNGIVVAVNGSLVQLAKVDLVMVCAGLEPTQYGRSPKVYHPLRRLARHGSKVGAISSGSFLLADAGLLAGRRCTVHWEYADAFRLRHPELRVTKELYVVDRDVVTCSGGTAALDMMLRFVTEAAGADLALAVAEQVIHPRIRKQEDHQRLDIHARYAVDSPILIETIRLMEGALEEPYEVGEIAARLHVSARQIERLFREYLDSSPKAFYRELRLARARTLLRHTSNSLRAISLECGFGSLSHFCHAYKRVYGGPPSRDRRSSKNRGTTGHR